MKKYWKIVLIIAVCAMVFAACSTRTSDSGKTLKTIGNKIDSNIYKLNVTMLDAPVSNRTMGGEGVQRQYSDIYGFGNSRLWQDGKGMIAVHVNSISPSLNYIQPGTDIVLKTTDLKIMAIDPGYSFDIRCRSDYEPVASLQNNEVTNGDYDTYELDYCRMATPKIVPVEGE